ncbi:MAG TPA: hypothetical protein EYQ50_07490 [Verrucomicrobiales bacterium]|nr:hypothetical protein [Verrucomicrobiales bacterium]
MIRTTCIAFAVISFNLSSTVAQDYLSDELRGEVQELKRSALEAGASQQNGSGLKFYGGG